MVTPDAVRSIVLDAARLVKRGEIVVFGSASLAFWLRDAPRSRDVDMWVVPEERGEIVEALMGELSWYHDRHDAYVEVLGPETFEAPRSWRERARRIVLAEAPDVVIIVPHPHDVLIAKLPRFDPGDQEHIQSILRELPIDREHFDSLVAQSPNCEEGASTDASAAFQLHAKSLRLSLQ